MSQQGRVRWRRVDGAYAIATGSGLAFGVAERPIVLGELVTIVRMESFGMWRIA